MSIQDFKIDLKELEMDKKRNRAERLQFVKLWAEYVRTHTDKEWSKQQNILINSIFQNSLNCPLTREQYLKLKGEQFKGK